MKTDRASLDLDCDGPVGDGSGDWRHEIKLPLRNRTPAGIEASIRSHRLGFETLHPERWIQNLYFDTPSLSAFYAAEAGLDRRVKVRLRWYGEDPSPTAGQLEWKWRAGAAGWKWTVPVDWGEALEKVSHAALRAAVRGELDGRQRSVFDALAVPTLHNCYHRRYFVSRDGRVRLTWDSQLAFGPQSGGLSFQAHRAISCPRLDVLEIKVAFDRREDARRAASGFAYRPARFSKYGTGVALFLGTRT